ITVTLGLKKLFVPALVVLAIVAAAFIIWQFLPGKKVFKAPVIENSVAVISFENLTGEEKYDYYRRSIPNLLITNLENAGLSYVVSWERMQDLLKQTRRREGEIIESESGFEICRREGVQALVTGSINKAGDMFAIELRILDAETKRHIKTATSRGIGEQSIIETQIDELSREIAQGIGIAQNKIDESKIHISEVTTESMEAYNLYLKGVESYFKLYLDEAQRYLEEALSVDPAFASAYRILALVHHQAENPKAREEALIKAKAFSEKTAEKERLFIEATYAALVEADLDQSLNIYYRIIEKYPKEKRAYFWAGVSHYLRGDSDKAIEPFQKAIELDPDFGNALNMIAYSHSHQGDYDKAISYFEKYASVYPEQANPLDSLGDLYFIMGRLDDAIEKYKDALKIKPDFGSSLMLSYLYALKEDYAEALNWIDRYISKTASPGRKAGGHFWKGFYHYWLGNSEECFAEFQTAEDQAEQIKNQSLKAGIDALRGWVYYDRGDFDRSRQSFQRWHEAAAEQLPSFQKSLKALYLLYIGFVDLKQGQMDSAQSKVKQIESILSDIKLDNQNNFQNWMTLLKGELWLAKGSAQQAIAIAENIEAPPFHSYNMRSGQYILYNIPFLKDMLARAYIKNDEPDKAIAQYERLIAFDPQQEDRYLAHPVYHYRLAILYEEKGWEGKAMEEYEKFLALWKDADPEFTEVTDARKRLAALQ
ncbi:MAG: tetratricopeptide repeat protein, partial [Candidatus Aminicenantes bacterium]|nr:tetratricopeptide repeat protein [Candidatus Aminicenantes bacterium]